jgi:Ca2+-binding RTX toxin-like protein
MNYGHGGILKGGPGDDLLGLYETVGGQALGGPGDDEIQTYAYSPDRLDGGPGDDTYQIAPLSPAPYGLVAGPGFDTLDAGGWGFSLNFDMSLCPGCVERIIGSSITSHSGDHITGDAGRQVILGGPSADVIDGGGGRDQLSGGGGDDTITSLDGVFDTVDCGDGTDTVLADPFDLVNPDCENVIRESAPKL